MAVLLIDANLEGHAALLSMRLGSDVWREFRAHLDIQFLNLDQAGLGRDATDSTVWRFCQAHGYFLLTANRNLRSADSIEATIRRESTDDSLPVFTLATPERLFQSPGYLDEVVESLLEYLLDEETCRGAGRIYLP